MTEVFFILAEKSKAYKYSYSDKNMYEIWERVGFYEFTVSISVNKWMNKYVQRMKMQEKCVWFFNCKVKVKLVFFFTPIRPTYE